MPFLLNGSNQFWLPVTAIWRGAHQTFIKALSNNTGLLGTALHGFWAPLMIRSPERNWQLNRHAIHMKNLQSEGVIISLSFFSTVTWVQWLSLAPPPRATGLLQRRAFKKEMSRSRQKKEAKRKRNAGCTYDTGSIHPCEDEEREVSIILEKKKNIAEWIPDWAWLNLNGFLATLICLLFQIFEKRKKKHCRGSCGVILSLKRRRWRSSLWWNKCSCAECRRVRRQITADQGGLWRTTCPWHTAVTLYQLPSKKHTELVWCSQSPSLRNAWIS